MPDDSVPFPGIVPARTGELIHLLRTHPTLVSDVLQDAPLILSGVGIYQQEHKTRSSARKVFAWTWPWLRYRPIFTMLSWECSPLACQGGRDDDWEVSSAIHVAMQSGSWDDAERALNTYAAKAAGSGTWAGVFGRSAGPASLRARGTSLDEAVTMLRHAWPAEEGPRRPPFINYTDHFELYCRWFDWSHGPRKGTTDSFLWAVYHKQERLARWGTAPPSYNGIRGALRDARKWLDPVKGTPCDARDFLRHELRYLKQPGVAVA